jgi:hypothetical protein
LVSIISFSVTSASIPPPIIAVRLGCENGFGSIKIASQVNIVSGQMNQHPANAGFPVAMDLSALVYGTPQVI